MRTTELHPDLWSVIDAVVIESATSFTVLGERHELATARDGFSGDAALARETALANVLYRLLYIRPGQGDERDLAAVDPSPRDRLLALHAANTGRGTWRGGWVVQELAGDGRLRLKKEGLSIWVAPEEIYAPDGAPRVGHMCDVWIDKELRTRVPGFYFADGEAPDECGNDDPAPLVRYYWHLTSNAAVPFIAAATERLNADEVPFCLKVLVDPHAFRRADAGLIFLRRRYHEQAWGAIAHIHAAVEPLLRESVPMFTKAIARGLGAAESPSGPVSFGDHRCKLAARGFWRSFRNGDRDRAARAATIAKVFKKEGLDSRCPYLAAGSTDHFQLSIACGSTPRRAAFDAVAIRPTISPGEAAIRIGESLCRQAIWRTDANHCNWIGRMRESDTKRDIRTTVVAAALGPGFREGAAGIALFLAQLHAVTGNEEFRRTAQAALNRSRLPAVGRAQPPASTIRSGPGKAREAAMHSFLALREEEFKERRLAEARAAMDLVIEAIDAHIAAPRYDATIRDGLAGLGEVLLAAGLAIGEEFYLDRARRLAQTLIDRYSEQNNWPTGFPDGGPNPSLDLGTAGIGYWLLRLDEPGRVPSWLVAEEADANENTQSALWPPGWHS